MFTAGNVVRHKDVLAIAVTPVSNTFINTPLAHIFTLIFQRCPAERLPDQILTR